MKAVSPDQYQEKADDGDGYCLAYDAFGRLQSVRDPYGNLVEQCDYDVAGRLLALRDEVGLIYRAEYDFGGRMTGIYTSDALENAAARSNPIQTYEYDSQGNVIGVTNGEQDRTDMSSL